MDYTLIIFMQQWNSNPASWLPAETISYGLSLILGCVMIPFPIGICYFYLKNDK
jgi:hypothetical protein